MNITGKFSNHPWRVQLSYLKRCIVSEVTSSPKAARFHDSTVLLPFCLLLLPVSIVSLILPFVLTIAISRVCRRSNICIIGDNIDVCVGLGCSLNRNTLSWQITNSVWEKYYASLFFSFFLSLFTSTLYLPSSNHIFLFLLSFLFCYWHYFLFVSRFLFFLSNSSIYRIISSIILSVRD